MRQRMDAAGPVTAAAAGATVRGHARGPDPAVRHPSGLGLCGRDSSTPPRRTIDCGAFILGPEVAAFEAEFAEYLGAEHVIGVANGTDALTIALRAMGVGPGDEVVVPSFTFYASAEAIPPTGARPVFCASTPRR